MSYLINQGWKLFPDPSSFNKIPEHVNIRVNGIPASVPGTVHTDLFNAGLIPDPFVGKNELDLQWIAELSWIYETKFDVPVELLPLKSIEIIFEGLDTIAQIYLNQEFVGKTENMFISYCFNLSRFVKEKNNSLKIHFKSPLAYGQRIIKKYGVLSSAINKERVYIRKAQYSFGWDWGPSFPTMGIWKNVYLQEHKTVSIRSVHFDTLSIDRSKARIQIRIFLTGEVDNHNKIEVNLRRENVYLTKSIRIKNQKSIIVEFVIENPELWWPNGLGSQNMYELDVRLTNRRNECIDEWSRKVGIRTIELRLKNENDNMFGFIINGQLKYIKGANWIPADSFLPRVSDEKYSHLLSIGKDCNLNMIRIWGGGIYESDKFYELCDHLGLLVWQDCMFACSSYPEYDWFLRNITEEIEQNVHRLQHHPSIALWCGNNENEWIWFQEKKQQIKKMPGYVIFHDLIPKLIYGLDPNRPYWPSSPFGFEDDPNSEKSGNRHIWHLWSQWLDYIEVKKDRSLFVTEFGFQAPANYSTFETVLKVDALQTQGDAFEFHNKQVEGQERLFKYLAGHLPIKTEFEDFIYLTQLNQGLAIKTCLEHWMLLHPHCSGSIIWQLNDCWPAVSWSLIDSNLRRKLVYYFVKNTFNPISLFCAQNNDTIEFICLNENHLRMNVIFKIAFLNIPSGKVTDTLEFPIQLSNRSRICLYKLNLSTFKENGLNQIVIGSIYDSNNQLLSRNYFCTKRWKYIQLPNTEFTMKLSDSSEGIDISVDKAAFFVTFYHKNIDFSENGLIILPGEIHKIKKVGTEELKLKDIKIYSLNNYLQ